MRRRQWRSSNKFYPLSKFIYAPVLPLALKNHCGPFWGENSSNSELKMIKFINRLCNKTTGTIGFITSRLAVA